MPRLKFIPALLAIILMGRLSAAQTGTQEVIIPIVAVGPATETVEFQTTVRFLPLSTGGTAFFEIAGFANSGGLFNVACDFTPISVFGQTPGGFSYRICAGLRFADQTVDGWVKVTTPVNVKVTGELALLQKGQIMAIGTVPAIQPAKNFRALVVEATEGIATRQSAFSLVNPSRTQTATADVIIIDRFGNAVLLDGTMPITTKVALPPLNRVSRFLLEFLTEGPTAPIKNPADFLVKRGSFFMIKVSSDIPIAVGGLQVVSSPAGLHFISMTVEVAE